MAAARPPPSPSGAVASPKGGSSSPRIGGGGGDDKEKNEASDLTDAEAQLVAQEMVQSLKITGTRKVQKTKTEKMHVEYIVHVTTQIAGVSWNINRRYNSFVDLHSALKKLVKAEKDLPPLPPKHSYSLTRTSTPEQIDKRKNELNAYLNALLKNPLIAKSEVWCSFLVGTFHDIFSRLKNFAVKNTGSSIAASSDSPQHLTAWDKRLREELKGSPLPISTFDEFSIEKLQTGFLSRAASAATPASNPTTPNSNSHPFNSNSSSNSNPSPPADTAPSQSLLDSELFRSPARVLTFASTGRDRNNATSLPHTYNDSVALRQFLLDQCGFVSDAGSVVAAEITTRQLLESTAAFFRTEAPLYVWCWLGHGVAGSGHLVLQNDNGEVRLYSPVQVVEAFRDARVSSKFEGIPAHLFILSDSCYIGAAINELADSIAELKLPPYLAVTIQGSVAADRTADSGAFISNCWLPFVTANRSKEQALAAYASRTPLYDSSGLVPRAYSNLIPGSGFTDLITTADVCTIEAIPGFDGSASFHPHCWSFAFGWMFKPRACPFDSKAPAPAPAPVPIPIASSQDVKSARGTQFLAIANLPVPTTSFMLVGGGEHTRDALHSMNDLLLSKGYAPRGMYFVRHATETISKAFEKLFAENNSHVIVYVVDPKPAFGPFVILPLWNQHIRDPQLRLLFVIDGPTSSEWIDAVTPSTCPQRNVALLASNSASTDLNFTARFLAANGKREEKVAVRAHAGQCSTYKSLFEASTIPSPAAATATALAPAPAPVPIWYDVVDDVPQILLLSTDIGGTGTGTNSAASAAAAAEKLIESGAVFVPIPVVPLPHPLPRNRAVRSLSMP